MDRLARDNVYWPAFLYRVMKSVVLHAVGNFLTSFDTMFLKNNLLRKKMLSFLITQFAYSPIELLQHMIRSVFSVICMFCSEITDIS